MFSVCFSILYIGITIYFSYRLYIRLLRNKICAGFAVYCLILMPVTGYLAGKLLSETLALLLVTISLLNLASALDDEGPTAIWLSIGSGVFLTLAALARLDILLCFFGFFVAHLFFAYVKNL